MKGQQGQALIEALAALLLFLLLVGGISRVHAGIWRQHLLAVQKSLQERQSFAHSL